MIHIVFNEADVNVLNEAIALDEDLQGKIVQVKDDYAVGPIQDLQGEGREVRKKWWSGVLEGGDYAHLSEDGAVNDTDTLNEVISTLRENEEEKVWIWAAQNKHDVSGYYFILSYLKEFQGRIFILYLNNLPFINEKGSIFYPQWLSEIPAREFLKAKKLAREITTSEFEVDPDEWEKLAAAGKGVRVLEGGKKLVQEDYDFYDAELRKYITPDWQKASKIIHQFLAKAKHTTGDAFLLWRLKKLVESEHLDSQGKTGLMKDLEIKTKSPAL